MALVRRFGTLGTARLATIAGIRIVHGEVRDQARLVESMRGCRAVIHCAVDCTGSQRMQRETTTLGTEAVLEASHRNGVKRLIFLSTAAVHSWTKPGEWDEEAPFAGRDVYSRSKIEAERLLTNNGLVPVTIIRPTCVYGPFSATWTVAPVQYLRSGIPLVASDNAGRANLIYIDNLVDLILCALDAADARDRVYLANDDEPLDWTVLFSAYTEAIEMPLLRYACPHDAWTSFREEVSVSIHNLGLLLGAVRSSPNASLTGHLRTLHRHVPLIQRFARLVPRTWFVRLSQMSREDGNVGSADCAAPVLRSFTPRSIREFYGTQARFSARRAKTELGWEPRISADQAISNTCAWIRYTGL